MTPELATPAPLGVPAALRSALTGFAVLYFATGFDLYGYAKLSAPNPTYVNLAIAALLAALALTDLRRPSALLRSPLLLWLAGWLAVTGIWTVLVGTVPGSIELMERFKAMFLLGTMMVAFDDPRARRAGALALAAAVVVLAACNLADLLGLVRFQSGLVDAYARQRVEGRASGLIFNANEAGRTITFATAVALWWLPRRWRVPLLLVGALGLLVTFSRGSIILFVILVLWALRRRQVTGWPSLLAVGAIGLAAAAWVSGYAQELLSSVGAWNRDVALRLHVTQWASDDSGRGAVLAGAWAEFLRAPLLGHPYGDSELLAPHNQYVAFAVDHGVIGFLILPALALAIVRAERRMAPFALMALVAGLFTHVLVKEHGFLVAAALAAAGTPGPRPDEVPAGDAPPAGWGAAP